MSATSLRFFWDAANSRFAGLSSKQWASPRYAFGDQTTETAGFYNFAGFNDDTRALLSIPARHVVARRVESALVTWLVAEHRLDADEATQIAIDLAGALPTRVFKL